MKNIVPPIALTMGDASGIGPEIVAKLLAKGGQRVVVFGSCVVMQDIVRRLGLDIDVRRINAPDAAQFQPRIIEVIETTRIVEPPPLGRSARFPGRRPSMPSLQRSRQPSPQR
ncbi:hypothetical protein VRC18_09150 [Pseudomonas trivialis]|uniref:hypothetical protein n=1 Tax=Pseudomonas trivialis TaxID=200450 RepID=UPI0030D479CE